MNILDRYILAFFSRILLLATAAFAGIYLLVEFFERIDNFIDHRATPAQYFLYFSCKLPIIVTQILPLAMLMAVFMTLGGFSRTSELTAMRAGGLSLWRIASPLLVIAAAFSLLLLAVGEFIVPASARTMNRIYEVELKGKPEFNMRRENIWFREGKKIVHIRLAQPERQILSGVSIYGMDEAFRIAYRFDAQEAVHDGNGWLFRGVVERRFGPAGDLDDLRQVPETRYPLDKTPADFVVPENKNLELGIGELRSLVSRLQAEGYNTDRYRVDLQARLATPFACLVLAFLGIPFALQNGRGASLAIGITISVSIGFTYFILQAMLQAFGYSGVLPPLVAAWSANLIFGLLGIWLLLWARE